MVCCSLLSCSRLGGLHAEQGNGEGPGGWTSLAVLEACTGWLVISSRQGPGNGLWKVLTGWVAVLCWVCLRLKRVWLACFHAWIAWEDEVAEDGDVGLFNGWGDKKFWEFVYEALIVFRRQLNIKRFADSRYFLSNITFLNKNLNEEFLVFRFI